MARKKVNHYHVSTDTNQIARLSHAFEHLELDGMKS